MTEERRKEISAMTVNEYLSLDKNEVADYLAYMVEKSNQHFAEYMAEHETNTTMSEENKVNNSEKEKKIMTREERKAQLREKWIEHDARVEEMIENRCELRSVWFGQLSDYGFSLQDLITAYVLCLHQLEYLERVEKDSRGSEDEHGYAYLRLCAVRDLFLPLDGMLHSLCADFEGSSIDD